MSLKDFFKSNHYNKLLIILAVAVVLIFVFSLGLFVGHGKGRFSCRWGENYYRNIVGPRGFSGMDFGRPQFNAHSGLGEIIKIEGNSLVVKGPDNVEKTIIVNEKTEIRKFNQALKLTDLSLGENIVVVGGPNDQGQIEAKLIRVMPNSPGGMMFPFRERTSTTTDQL